MEEEEIFLLAFCCYKHNERIRLPQVVSYSRKFSETFQEALCHELANEQNIWTKSFLIYS